MEQTIRERAEAFQRNVHASDVILDADGTEFVLVKRDDADVASQKLIEALDVLEEIAKVGVTFDSNGEYDSTYYCGANHAECLNLAQGFVQEGRE